MRLEKVPQLRNAGYHPYAERFERTHRLHEASSLPDGEKGVRVAGRIIALRYFGKLALDTFTISTGKSSLRCRKTNWANNSMI